MPEIDLTKIERAYSGKTGCMCGCVGKYTEDPEIIKRLHSNMLKFIEQWGVELVEDDKHFYTALKRRVSPYVVIDRTYVFYKGDVAR